MPSYPPRSSAIKKQDQLYQREVTFRKAVLKNLAPDKILEAAEKYRSARLLLLKAQMHIIRDMEFEKKSHFFNIEKINADFIHWTNITAEEIVKGFK